MKRLLGLSLLVWMGARLIFRFFDSRGKNSQLLAPPDSVEPERLDAVPDNMRSLGDEVRDLHVFVRKPFWHRHDFWIGAMLAIVIAFLTTIITLNSGLSKTEFQEAKNESSLELAQKTELSAQIRYLNVVLSFQSPISPETLDNQRPFVILLMKNRGARLVHLKTVVVPGYAWNGGTDGPRLWNFAFFSSIIDESGPVERRYQRGHGLSLFYGSPLTELLLPISVSPSEQPPFPSIRDLEDVELQVFLPDSLATTVKRIDLVANSDYGFGRRFRLLSNPVSNADWRKTNINVETFFDKATRPRFLDDAPQELKMRMLNNGSRWRIILENTEWEIHNVIPDLDPMRQPYQ